MFHRWAAPLLVLALCATATTPKNAAGQANQQTPREQGAKGKLGKNYPNPFNPDTKINFSVDCSGNTSEVHVVSMRIMNILAQPAVTPILYGPAATSTSGATTSMNGSSLADLRLGCGDYLALWPPPNSREPASGTYIVQYFVDGKLAGTRRIYYRK